MILREAKLSDLFEIVEIWKDFIDFHKNLDTFFTRADNGHIKFYDFIKKALQDERYLLTVAEIDFKIVGYCLAQISQNPPVFINTGKCQIFDLVIIVLPLNRIQPLIH